MSSKLVVVKPIRKNIWGDFTVSGAILGKDKKPIWPEDKRQDGTTEPRTVQFSGTGILLDMEDEEHKKMYRVMTECKGAMQKFMPAPSGGTNPSQRFTIENIQEKAETYLKSRERKAEVETFIATVAKDEGALRRFALCFGLKGSVEVIKQNLYQMIDDDKQRPKLATLINNPDRQMLELIHTAVTDGDASKKTGMWKDGRQMYFWNELPLALGVDELVAHLKSDKGADMYEAIKAQHGRKIEPKK